MPNNEHNDQDKKQHSGSVAGAKKIKKKKEGNQYNLTDKQLAFVEAYIVTENATESYARAYKTDNRNVAGVQGHKLLQNSKIQKQIEQRIRDLQNNTDRIASPEELLQHLTSILTSPSEKTADRIRAAELIGKHYGAWIDRTEVNQTTDFVIELNGNFDKPKEILDAKAELIEHDGDED